VILVGGMSRMPKV